jgi:hypothetical protein
MDGLPVGSIEAMVPEPPAAPPLGLNVAPGAVAPAASSASLRTVEFICTWGSAHSTGGQPQ